MLYIDKKAVGKRIRKVMEQLNTTQEGFAELLEISQPAVSLYLQGRVPSPQVLLEVARLGNVSMEWLLTGLEIGNTEGKRPLSSEETVLRERLAPYGEAQEDILHLWKRLPKTIQQDLYNLIKHLVGVDKINTPAKAAASSVSH